MEQLICKCGARSKGTELVTYYKRLDGVMSKYVRIEKRCQNCINATTRIANARARNRKRTERSIDDEKFIGY